MAERLIIVGAGGHGKVVADAALASDMWDAVAFVDSTPGIVGQSVVGLPVIAASIQDLPDRSDMSVHVAIGDNATRRKISQELVADGYELATVYHPSATVSRFAELGAGVSIMAGAIIQVGVRIADGVIVNTGARIDHDCQIGGFCHISPGAVLAGNVRTGDETWIGAGVTVRDSATIGSGLVIGAGSVVVSNVGGAVGQRFAGVPAKPLLS